MRKVAATVSSLGSRGEYDPSLPRMVQWPRWRPVISMHRDGAQTCPEYPREKFMPFCASRSILGVGMRKEDPFTCFEI